MLRRQDVVEVLTGAQMKVMTSFFIQEWDIERPREYNGVREHPWFFLAYYHLIFRCLMEPWPARSSEDPLLEGSITSTEETISETWNKTCIPKTQQQIELQSSFQWPKRRHQLLSSLHWLKGRHLLPLTASYNSTSDIPVSADSTLDVACPSDCGIDTFYLLPSTFTLDVASYWHFAWLVTPLSGYVVVLTPPYAPWRASLPPQTSLSSLLHPTAAWSALLLPLPWHLLPLLTPRTST